MGIESINMGLRFATNVDMPADLRRWLPRLDSNQ
jgi:hypothetical protein